jgi:adenylate cyclase
MSDRRARGTTNEIERRYRVVDSESVLTGTVPTQIVQGYLSLTEHGDVRVRMTPDLATIAYNGPRFGAARLEWETVLPLDVADLMLNMCGKRVVAKARYSIADEYGQLWSVDRYQDANDGLVLAEIELESPHTHVDRPAWLGVDVTNDDRFFNRNLAVTPYRAS